MEIMKFKEMGSLCKLTKETKENYNKIIRNPSLVNLKERKLTCMDICLANEVDLTPFLELKNEEDVAIATNTFLMTLQKN